MKLSSCDREREREVVERDDSPNPRHLFEKVESSGSVGGREEFHDAGHNLPLVLLLPQQFPQPKEGSQHR